MRSSKSSLPFFQPQSAQLLKYEEAQKTRNITHSAPDSPKIRTKIGCFICALMVAHRNRCFPEFCRVSRRDRAHPHTPAHTGRARFQPSRSWLENRGSAGASPSHWPPCVACKFPSPCPLPKLPKGEGARRVLQVEGFHRAVSQSFFSTWWKLLKVVWSWSIICWIWARSALGSLRRSRRAVVVSERLLAPWANSRAAS